jgi:hypothetical protein
VIRVLDPTGCGGKPGALAGFHRFVTIILRSGVVKRFAVTGFGLRVGVGRIRRDTGAAQAAESLPDPLEQGRKRLAARRAPDFAVV